MPDDLKSTLERYSSAAITMIAAYHGVAPKHSKVKTKMIESLTRVLVEPQTIDKSVATLSKGERAALDAILRREGRAPVAQIRGDLLRLKLIDREYEISFGKYVRNTPTPRQPASRRLEDLLAALTLRGLVFSAEDPADPKRGIYDNATKCDLDQQLINVFIPDAIRPFLPAPAPLPELAAAKAVDVKSVQESSARAFQRDLYLYWSFVRARPVTLTAKGEIQKRTLVELNNALLVHDEIPKGVGEQQLPRLRFMRGLLQALDLLTLRTPYTELITTEHDEFFSLSPAERVQRVYAQWLDGTFFNELLVLPRDQQPTQPPLLPAPPQIVTARRSVIAQIRQLTSYLQSRGAPGEPLEWLATAQLIDQLFEYDREFLLPRVTNRSLYYGYTPPHAYSGHNAPGWVFPGVRDAQHGWQTVETAFIHGLLGGPLHWQGLIDLGWAGERAGEPTAFRLTALGAWLLGLGPQPEIRAEGGRVIVQPNLHIVALDPVNDATLVSLDRFAERLSAERAVEYQLTRASVYRGQQQGWDVPRIKEFLRQQTNADLPGNVARTLDEWQTLHERIVIRPHVALAHGSPAALDTLLNDGHSTALIIARPQPDVALAQANKAIQPLTHALHRHGVLPLITQQPSVPPNSIVIADDGTITFTTRAPSLYLHGHLAAIANPIDDEQQAAAHYQVTSETIERAMRSGLTAPQIIERLAAVQRGPLPDRLVRRIRAWAKYYGDAAIEALTLLQVRDDDTLNELLADPELAALIKPFSPAKTRALARVREKDLDALRALLSERGIDLTDKLK
ncbi:MAG: helicase-associated domain-containing protein [Chloroflexi bacterium]|nr:helicase-associated domain-containing protein [Chloroflexota bacterium]